MSAIEAEYLDGVLLPKEPLHLRAGERVRLLVLREGDPKRWDADRLRTAATDEEIELAEQGLGEWADDLDGEDRA